MKYFILNIFLFIAVAAMAQQNSQYSHYLLNYYSENPAVAGSTKCVDFKMGGRYQWLGMEGAPSSIFASIHGPIGNKKKPYKKSKHGIGLYVERDRMHIITQTYVKASYAYHQRLYRGLTGAAGIFAGVKQY